MKDKTAAAFFLIPTDETASAGEEVRIREATAPPKKGRGYSSSQTATTIAA
jgi:hypothetical protein